MPRYTCSGYSRGWDTVSRLKFYLQNLSRLLFDTQAPFPLRQPRIPLVIVIIPSSFDYLFPVEFWQDRQLRTNLVMNSLDSFIQYSVRNDIKLENYSTLPY